MNQTVYSIRHSCRSCASTRLVSVLSLGETFVSDFVDVGAPETGVRIPLELLLCEACGLVQLRHTTNPDLLWRQYWYRSGTNHTMRQALREIADRSTTVAGLAPGDLVLDIGCNDGTLLRAYQREGLRLFGFEPARNLIEDARVGTTHIINDYFSSKDFRKHAGTQKAKVITAISMFYDLEDPNGFVSGIGDCLDENGLFMIQMNYLVSMLRQNAFDNIGHEHLEYYSLTSLETLLARHGMEVMDAELTDLNGGSIRTYVRRRGASLAPLPGASQRLQAIRDDETQMQLLNRQTYDAFAERIASTKQSLCEFVQSEHIKGRVIYVYGASTRGSTLLQHFGLDRNLIRAAAERSPSKYGKKTTGTWIPIISEEQARAEKPDYFLVLPYFFLQEFQQRERDYLASGGKFIVPLPQFTVIGG